MPVYDYEILDPVTGDVLETVSIPRLIEARDRISLRRCTVPNSIAIAGAARLPTQRDEVLSGYYREECRHGSRFRSSYTKKQIADIWSAPS